MKGAWAVTVTPEKALLIKGIGLGWIWSLYNLLMIGIALLILLDVPKPSLYEWFTLRRLVQLQLKNQDAKDTQTTPEGKSQFWGVTTNLSEVGAQVALTQAGIPAISLGETLAVTLEILEEEVTLAGQVTETGVSGEFPTVQVMFEPLTLSQQRHLVELLFCRPGQWKRRSSPGELQSLWLLLKILLKPRVLFDRNPKVSAIAVSQT